MDLFLSLFFLGLVVPGLCLECYTCVNQDGNKDKCVKTTIQCEEHENTCYAQIRWGIPPYWRPHGDRIHFIHKGCIQSGDCTKWSENVRHSCRRDWYLDWECVECCRGDMCNYYVTLGSSQVRVGVYTMVLCFVLAVISRCLY